MVIAAVSMMYAGRLESWRLASLPHLEPCTSVEACCSSTSSLHLMAEAGARHLLSSSSSGSVFTGAAIAGQAGNQQSTAWSLAVQGAHSLPSSRRFLRHNSESGSDGGSGGFWPMHGVMGQQLQPAEPSALTDTLLQLRSCSCPNEPAPLSIFWQASAYCIVQFTGCPVIGPGWDMMYLLMDLLEKCDFVIVIIIQDSCYCLVAATAAASAIFMHK
jgi:hypothetical protein